MIRSLTYFDDAEHEPDPIMLTDVRWNEVKERMVAAVREIS